MKRILTSALPNGKLEIYVSNSNNKIMAIDAIISMTEGGGPLLGNDIAKKNCV